MDIMGGKNTEYEHESFIKIWIKVFSQVLLNHEKSEGNKSKENIVIT